VLTAPKVDTINSFDNPEAVKPAPIVGRVENQTVVMWLPAKSVSVVHIQTGGEK
jgi:alpha-N-arabinofuranosidase